MKLLDLSNLLCVGLNEHCHRSKINEPSILQEKLLSEAILMQSLCLTNTHFTTNPINLKMVSAQI